MAVIAAVTTSAVEGTETMANTARWTADITYPQRDKDEESGEVFEVTDDNGETVMLNSKQEHGTRPVVSDVVNSEEDNQVDTRTYRFYMPDNWYNDRNDNYDGKDLSSCCAGVYIWDCSYSSADYLGDNVNDWPGYRILERDPDCPNVFVCEIPEDAGLIIFNNTVDAGKTHTNPNYGLNFQTNNTQTQYVDPEDDPYKFYDYPIESFDGMICVANPQDAALNEFSGATAYGAEWFYYYGEGKYGIYKTLEEAEEAGQVYQNGDFPSALQISDAQINNYLNNDPTYTVYCSADPENVNIYAEDDSIVSLSDVSAVTAADKVVEMFKSKVTITGLAEGATNVVFEETTVDEEGNEQVAVRRCKIENGYQRPTVSVSNKSVEIGKTVKLNPTIRYATSVTYKSSNTKVATVDSKGVVKGVAAGTAKITVTAKAGTYNIPATATVTVKKLANTMKVTAKTATASAKKDTKLTASKYVTVSKAAGKVTYAKASGDKKITIAKDGKMTVKKGLKKGKTFTVKVKVTDAGSAKVAGASKTVSVKVKIK
jgi:hypothetical protein